MKTLIQEVASPHVSEEKSFLGAYEEVLNTGLYELEDIERKAIFLRFWAPSSIEQVSKELKVSWDTADQIINRSIEKLRAHFLKHEMSFSLLKETRNT